MEFDIKTITEVHYKRALSYSNVNAWIDKDSVNSLDHWVERITGEIENVFILIQEEYEDFKKSYDGYCEQEDVGKYIWYDGECYCSEETVMGWCADASNSIKEGYNSFENYVQLFCVSEILSNKNTTLEKK